MEEISICVNMAYLQFKTRMRQMFTFARVGVMEYRASENVTPVLLHGDAVRRRKTHQQGRIASFSFFPAALLILHVTDIS